MRAMESAMTLVSAGRLSQVVSSCRSNEAFSMTVNQVLTPLKYSETASLTRGLLTRMSRRVPKASEWMSLAAAMGPKMPSSAGSLYSHILFALLHD
jgi:F0F1-type ATP synthase gamma subunit